MKDKQDRRVLPNLLNPEPEPKPEVDPLLEEWGNDDDINWEEMQLSTRECFEQMRKDEAEIEAIKANRPLGSVVHREPKSLPYSKVPDPVWKRKLRP